MEIQEVETVQASQDGYDAEDMDGLTEIQELFSDEIVGFYADEQRAEGMYSFSEFTIDDIDTLLKDYFRYFTCEERDFIYLNFVCGKTQVELTEVFGKTQPALCNDSFRIKEEILTIRELMKSHDAVLAFLSDDKTRISRNDRQILLAFFFSFSITRTSKIVHLNPMLCRSRIDRAVKNLYSRGYYDMYAVFTRILNNLNGIKKHVDVEFGQKEISKYDYTSGYRSQEFGFE